MDRDVQTKLDGIMQKQMSLQSQIFAMYERLDRIERKLGMGRFHWLKKWLNRIPPLLKITNSP